MALTVLLPAVLLLSACSNSAATTTSPPPPTTEPAPTTTSAAPVTTTTAAPTTTTTTLAEGTVGDPAALQALAEQVARDSLIPIEEFFIPDITQPDPIEALKELLAYSDWMVFNNPTKDLARIHTMDASPARTSEERVVDRLEDPDLRAVAPAPLVSEFFEIVSFSDLPATDGMISTFPSEAVAIAYLSSSDGYEIIRESTGEVLESIPPWTDLPIYVVVAPTSVGWQEYWYGS